MVSLAPQEAEMETAPAISKELVREAPAKVVPERPGDASIAA
jgi:hypothetical protein